MKNLLLMSAAVLSLCAFASAQSPFDATCPTVYVHGSAQNPKESIQFAAVVDLKSWQGSIEYRWTVSWTDPLTRKIVSAVILEGQGTPNVKVFNPRTNVLAKIEITGFPSNCFNTASEITAWDPAPEATKLTQFRGRIVAQSKLEWINIRARVIDNPNARFLVICGYAEDTPQRVIDKKRRKLIEILTSNGIDSSRFTFLTLPSVVEIVQFWLVPAGASDPTCDECEVSKNRVAGPEL